jgi:VWFA-related protein
MGKTLVAVTVAVGLALPAGLAWPQQPSAVPPAKQEQGPKIRARVELVSLLATVLNRRGKFVTDLEKENFRVWEDGQLQQIRFFSRETDLALRIGLLLDTSNSIRNRLKFEQEAAIDFLHSVLRRQKDLAFLMTFDNEPDLIQDYTDDVGVLQEVILRQRAGGGTALYDAIYSACSERLTNPPPGRGANAEVRRVLVVISDGEDTVPGGRALSEATEMAQRAGVVIYAISTSTDWLSSGDTAPKKYHLTEGDQVLQQLAEQTGGRAFFPYRVDDLGQSFQDIGDELRSQYSFAYTPGNRIADGRYRRIRLEVDRKGLIVRTRKGYYATPGESGPGRPASPPSN